MKIAVTYESGKIFQHFGYTEAFKIYDIADGKVVNAQVVDTNGSGHDALAGFLVTHGVDTLICGGIGGGAQNALACFYEKRLILHTALQHHPPEVPICLYQSFLYSMIPIEYPQPAPFLLSSSVRQPAPQKSAQNQ